ncbi:MAG: ParA family protein [Bacteroidia bacterium]|nr:ParA family protein [Bacteroidia bacterium]MDW8158594.1 ParA family protein [Bacteroidia bacterium]
MLVIIAITNHKGGVGKTTTTINLGAALAQLGFKVLLIDMDPQANLTTSLNIKDRAGKTIYEGLKGTAHPFNLVVNVKDNLFVIPSSIELSNAEVELSAIAGREYLLAELIDPIKINYDFILIDCPPSLGILTLNAFTAAKYLLIAMQSEYLALQGFSKLGESMQVIKKRINSELEILGVLLTLYDARKNLHKDINAQVESYFGEKVFQTKIRDNITLAEAPKAGKDIFSYDASCNGAKDYLDLAHEVLTRLSIPLPS